MVIHNLQIGHTMGLQQFWKLPLCCIYNNINTIPHIRIQSEILKVYFGPDVYVITPQAMREVWDIYSPGVVAIQRSILGPPTSPKAG